MRRVTHGEVPQSGMLPTVRYLSPACYPRRGRRDGSTGCGRREEGRQYGMWQEGGLYPARVGTGTASPVRGGTTYHTLGVPPAAVPGRCNSTAAPLPADERQHHPGLCSSCLPWVRGPGPSCSPLLCLLPSVRSALASEIILGLESRDRMPLGQLGLKQLIGVIRCSFHVPSDVALSASRCPSDVTLSATFCNF